MVTRSAFALELAAIAQEEHTKFNLMDEADTDLCKQIKKYYTDIGFKFISCVSAPWSAVFVSFCVKKAGATASEFTFSNGHSVFVYQAIQNALKGTGLFHGLEISAYQPGVGDIIHNNRLVAKYDYAYARTHKTYLSHSAIVVETGEDTNGRYALTIGGNESDSIRRKLVQLTKEGFIKQRPNNPFISVIRTLK